ncbi:hypothetical protein ACFQ0B_50555 [Nonomuraea thailandensis]
MPQTPVSCRASTTGAVSLPCASAWPASCSIRAQAAGPLEQGRARPVKSRSAGHVDETPIL